MCGFENYVGEGMLIDTGCGWIEGDFERCSGALDCKREEVAAGEGRAVRSGDGLQLCATTAAQHAVKPRCVTGGVRQTDSPLG